MKTKSPLSYFGSDASVAEKIGRYFDSCSHVTIPFVGGASILPHLKATRIVANDLNDLAINFYRCMSGPAGFTSGYGEESRNKLISRCQHTLSHPTELQTALEDLALPFGCGWNVEHAWAYWGLCWLGRGGQGGTEKITKQTKPSFRMSPSGGSNASRLRSAADDLEAWAKQFERCEWRCMDFRELLPKVKWDNPKCGVYIDAPWVDEGGAYLHSFRERDHRELARFAHNACDSDWFADADDNTPPSQCKILIRYGDCPLIRELYDHEMFFVTTAKTSNQANNTVDEIWITNYQVAGENDGK